MVYTYISPDKRYVVSACSQLTIIDLKNKKTVAQIADEMVERVAFSPDSKRLCSALKSGELVIWKTESGEEIKRLDLGQKDAGGVWCAWSHDGRWVAATDGSHRLHIFDARSWAEVRTIQLGDPNDQDSKSYLVSFTRKDKYLVATSSSGSCDVYSVTGK